MKYDNNYKESIFKFKSMFHGIKCTEIEKTTAVIDHESLNPTYKYAVSSLLQTVFLQGFV